MHVCNWTKDPQGEIDYWALACQKNLFPRILKICGITFEFKYLGEFEFIFQNNLGLESEDQEIAFDEKNECRKSRARVPLNVKHSCNTKWYIGCSRSETDPLGSVLWVPWIRCNSF
jgi:hypothetical protein